MLKKEVAALLEQQINKEFYSALPVPGYVQLLLLQEPGWVR